MTDDKFRSVCHAFCACFMLFSFLVAVCYSIWKQYKGEIPYFNKQELEALLKHCDEQKDSQDAKVWSVIKQKLS